MTAPALRRVDLHVHSTASDGSLTPAELVRSAAAGRIDVLAITDHDTTAGYVEAAAEAVDAGVLLVPGVEISSTFDGQDLHVLGYFVDPASLAMVGHGAAAGERRRERLIGMGMRLIEMGVPLFEEDVHAVASMTRTPGRPHLARLLVERGLVRSHAEAFDRYLGNRAPAYIAIELLTPAQAVSLVRAAGGVPVWAHPPLDTVVRDLPAMLRWGIEGLEAVRPNHAPEDERLLTQLAARHGLLVSGGSDWHGAWHGSFGAFGLPARLVEGLLRRGGIWDA